MLTPEQTWAGLAPLIGGGGISAVLVAFIGFLAAARAGRKAPDPPPFFGGSQPNRWDEISAGHLGTIAYAASKFVAIEEMRAELEAKDGTFHDRMEAKIGRMMIEAFKATGIKSG